MSSEDQSRRWARRLDQAGTEPVEPLVLDQAMIGQWLQNHRAEYPSATEAVRACMAHFRLHRRHRKMLWAVYSRTDFS